MITSRYIIQAALVAAWLAPPAHAGVTWQQGPLSEVKQLAKKQGKRVVVKFTASWCSVCKILDQEFLRTDAAGRITQDMVAVQVDFDAPENRPLVEHYVILGLPTTIVLKPDGQEAGRIMGFDGAAAFGRSLEDLKQGEVALSSLQAAVNKHPSDPSALRLLGQALLERGDKPRGEALLERVTWLSPRSDAAAQALFVLGRYHHRVRKDPRQARHVWRELASRFPTSIYAPGAWWWYARAQSEIGRPDTGAYALQQLTARQTEPKAAQRALNMWAGYVAKHKLPASDVVSALKRAIPKASGDPRKKLKASLAKVKALSNKPEPSTSK